MASNRRRGAVRKPGTKKGAVVGSGGQRRKALGGKGPTPPAELRPGHPKGRRAGAAGPKPPARSPRKERAGTAEPVAGRNAVLEALRASVPVQALYVAERIDADDRVREVFKISAERRLALLETPRQELDRLTGGAVHQGIALTMPAYQYAEPGSLIKTALDASQPPLVVALDGVTDPRNLGAVVRSAAAFGAHGVVVPQRRSAGMSVGAWKASAGTAATVPVARATNLARQLRSYADAGLFVVGLAASGDAEVGAIEVADQPLCLVVGSESGGMSRVVTQACDLVAHIPMVRGVESLNAGVAAGIALYEIARARH